MIGNNNYDEHCVNQNIENTEDQQLQPDDEEQFSQR
jgi:hypothetical protein